MMVLNIARGAHSVDESVVKTEINAKGNAVMKLRVFSKNEWLSKVQELIQHYLMQNLTVKVLGSD